MNRRFTKDTGRFAENLYKNASVFAVEHGDEITSDKITRLCKTTSDEHDYLCTGEALCFSDANGDKWLLLAQKGVRGQIFLLSEEFFDPDTVTQDIHTLQNPGYEVMHVPDNPINSIMQYIKRKCNIIGKVKGVILRMGPDLLWYSTLLSSVINCGVSFEPGDSCDDRPSLVPPGFSVRWTKPLGKYKPHIVIHSVTPNGNYLRKAMPTDVMKKLLKKVYDVDLPLEEDGSLTHISIEILIRIFGSGGFSFDREGDSLAEVEMYYKDVLDISKKTDWDQRMDVHHFQSPSAEKFRKKIKNVFVLE